MTQLAPNQAVGASQSDLQKLGAMVAPREQGEIPLALAALGEVTSTIEAQLEQLADHAHPVLRLSEPMPGLTEAERPASGVPVADDIDHLVARLRSCSDRVRDLHRRVAL